MNKIKSFFMSVILLAMTFAIVVGVALIYRANERMSVRSYIFQVNNYANQRVGELQDINDISPEDLRNKLIKKYVSEYFKVIPGDTDVTNRPILRSLSNDTAYEQWTQNEAKTIEEMSNKNMFRRVRVYDNGIATLNRPSDYDYKSGDVQNIYYAVRYYMQTWTEPNKMDTPPQVQQGTIYIEARFEPGIRETINGKHFNLKKHLQSNQSPVSLFKFTVTNIGNKEIR